MVGFGAAMPDTSAWLISDKLSSASHTQLMNARFNPSSWIDMSWVRVPMGSSDFSATAQPYSYDDMQAGRPTRPWPTSPSPTTSPRLSLISKRRSSSIPT